MARMDQHIVQLVDGEQIVFMDDSTGQEISIPAEKIDWLIGILAYFRRSLLNAEELHRRTTEAGR